MGNDTDQTEGDTQAFEKGQGQKIRCKTISKQHQEINKDTDIGKGREGCLFFVACLFFLFFLFAFDDDMKI